jgi:hypothetical protein
MLQLTLHLLLLLLCLRLLHAVMEWQITPSTSARAHQAMTSRVARRTTKATHCPTAG